MPQRKNVSAEIFWPDCGDGIAGRVGEFRDVLLTRPDAVAALVHKAVVMAAELDKILKACFAPVGPVAGVLWRAIIIRYSSVSSVATRVMARTLEKLIWPWRNESLIFGRSPSACATRTSSRA